ncbi:CKLF-like MARVEL transmembrane domain-containing protein 5 [Pelodiscus sinensis]|uniref:CKLF-like MARVEL transmembrane domain-containing protein 5 n=1 Tax=Pelodiscus sinensis TaxID=13735 RepID=UPI003F6CADC9
MGGPGLGEEGEAGGLALDWPFLRSTKGALLGAELALCFLVFLLLTVSVSAYMAAPLLEGLLAGGALGLQLVRCQERAPRVRWACLVCPSPPSTGPAWIFCARQRRPRLLVVSPAAIAASREGPSVCAFTFGLILIALFAYDACSTYWGELRPEPAPGDPPGPARR